MGTNAPRIALLYDQDAYREAPARPAGAPGVGPAGLMGRQVAGQAFLDALLTHGTQDELVGLVRHPHHAGSLLRAVAAHPSSRDRPRHVRVVEERHFLASFFSDPPATLLHTPCPPDPRLAWARQHGGPGRFALSGVTHTLASTAAVACLNGLVTAPFEPYDALICTSRAVADMVRAVTGAYADYLRERFGGRPSLRARLETIPLGVDPARYRPPTPAERAASRAALGVDAEEVVVLFVGRLSHHAKAHPFPMFRGVAEAARATGRRVRLVLAGWASNPTVARAFALGARDFAPGVQTTTVDGNDPETRRGIWHAADVFTSLSDNLQETFGLVVVEAMASGLPVVASDWDGYRDLVVPGETGLLVPTVMVRGATRDATARLLVGEVDYDHFLAECSQATAVDIAAASGAFARLIADPLLRRRMGEAGRRRVEDRFTWARVIAAYERLWREQEAERIARLGAAGPPRLGPAAYPAPEHSFEGYPTRWLGGGDGVEAVPGAAGELDRLLQTPLTHHEAGRRSADPTVLGRVLEAAVAPGPVADLDAIFAAAGVGHGAGRATLGWMLKYGLLRPARLSGYRGPAGEDR